ncbi:MAG: glycoside hydrolase family 95 protein, partial [Ignavibacteriae bacterium]|nr:glycoside hydrolase family 95 protein [Ignavibacteriota bacterium]
MKNYLKFVLAGIFFLDGFFCLAQSKNILWYNKPANYFEESLALGNGKMGATVFGGVNTDKIYLNDATLWSGEPVNADMNPDAYKTIPAIREALMNENYKLADSLQRKVQGSFSQSFAPLGTMFINFHHDESPQKYYRELNINNAISKTTYEINGVKFTREYFISYPDQVMIINLTSSEEGALNFDINFQSLLKFKVKTDNNSLDVVGYAPYHTEPSYRNNIKNTVLFDENLGTKFASLFKINNLDGEVIKTDSSIGLQNGSEAIIFISIATSFNGFDRNPATEGVDFHSIALKNLTNSFYKSFQDLKKNHIEDYQTYFNRVSLNLGITSAPDLPTDERLRRYAKGLEDKNLEILYFQYGRYLLISSSRTEGVPANLQGIWNPYIRPPWSSNFTININAEENYWLAENA